MSLYLADFKKFDCFLLGVALHICFYYYSIWGGHVFDLYVFFNKKFNYAIKIKF